MALLVVSRHRIQSKYINLKYSYIKRALILSIFLSGCVSNDEKRFLDSDEYKLTLVEIQNKRYLKDVEIDSSNLGQLRTASYYIISDDRTTIDSLMDYMEANLPNHQNIELNKINDIWELNGRRPKLKVQEDSIMIWETLLTNVGYKFDCKFTNWNFHESSIEEVFVNPEIKPIWRGCENDERPNVCSDMEFLRYFMSRFKYPTDIVDTDISDRLIVEFTITTNGNIEDVKVLKGKDLAIQSNAIEILKTMPRWIPGKMNDRHVPVKLNVPIRIHWE